MSTIDRVEVHEFTFDLADVGWDAGGFNIVYQPGNTLTLSKYAVVIRTADGGRGEYVALWGGTPMALAQTLALAPHLLGRDAHQREKIYDDFKRAHRQYDHMGFGCIDIALWDLAGKQFNVPISKLLGAIAMAGCRRHKRTLISQSNVMRWVTAPSRCMDGATVTSPRKWPRCLPWARRFRAA